MLECIVTKFGGSSLASDEQFRKVRSILELEPTRRYLVPSAPGKRFPNDEKVTDLLYKCHSLASEGKSFKDEFAKIRDRYLDIARGLHLKVDIESRLQEVEDGIASGKNADWCASRGEYLCALLMADYLGWRFLDAADGIVFNDDGQLNDEKTQEKLSALLADGKSTVVPGFYGAKENGEVHTFSRGGSDITGALVARAANADVYENWTDVSGFLMADPRIIENPAEISSITYKELRELILIKTIFDAAIIAVTNYEPIMTEAGMTAERQRIAHEIHDTLAQGLSSIIRPFPGAVRLLPFCQVATSPAGKRPKG